MTALLIPRAPRDERRTRADLQSVPTRRRQLPMPGFIAVVALVLALGMVGLLVLTTALQNQAFAVQGKQAEASRLANQLSDLQAQVAQARSVEHLGVAAQELGMKPNPYPAQLRLPDGTVVGRPTQVLGGEVPSVRHKTEAQAQAEEKARAEREAKAKAKAKAEAEAKAKAEAEAKAKAEAEAKAKAEAEAKAKAEAEAKAKATGQGR